MLRFIRLWQKLGLSIQQTDDLITALYAPPLPPPPPPGRSSTAASGAAATHRIGLRGSICSAWTLSDLAALLACWAPIGTGGSGSLYARMFLNPTVLKHDRVFAPDVIGNLLAARPPAAAAQDRAVRRAQPDQRRV